MAGKEEKSGVEHIGLEHQLPPGRHRRGWLLWLIVFLFAGGTAALLYAIHKNQEKAAAQQKAGMRARPTVTVTVASAGKGNIGVYVNSIGTVTPVYTSSITAQASGVITAVHYREGEQVNKGDPLIDIDPRPYEAQEEEAEGTLDRDTNLLAQARMDLDRYRVAWSRNSINKQQLDDQEKLVLQDEGTVKNDQGVVDYDKVNLSYCHVVSPIAGRVGLRLVDPGNVVQANGTTPLVVITQMQPITVIFTIAEDTLPEVVTRMRKAHTLPVEAWNREQTEQLAAGKVFTIDNQIDTATGTVKLRAMFDNKKGELFPNQFVNTRLLVDTQTGVTLIPSAAIQHNGDTAFVYVISDGKAKQSTVTTGVTDKDMTAVTGIEPGDVVATSSFDKLQNGSSVTVAKNAPAPANPNRGSAP
ncbi:MAG TPA: efflux RND transporter periplasmic adaptor subunit [Terracidiphilus sp.]|nr:efflux RND transporter periplasmic adaptor subunit [Terracidiphilus sp.]